MRLQIFIIIDLFIGQFYSSLYKQLLKLFPFNHNNQLFSNRHYRKYHSDEMVLQINHQYLNEQINKISQRICPPHKSNFLTHMSQQLQLLQVAKYLSQLLQVKIKSSPGQPQLIIHALKMLIPQGQQIFTQIEQLPEQQHQWNQIIQFIESQIFEQGMEFGFQKLDTEEIIKIYKVIIQMVQEAMEEDGEEGESQGQEQEQSKSENNDRINEVQLLQSQRNNQAQNQHPASSNQTGQGSSKSNNLPNQPSNTQNNQNLDYIQGLKKEKLHKKRQQQERKKQINEKHLKSAKKQQKMIVKKQIFSKNKEVKPNLTKLNKQEKIRPQSSLINQPKSQKPKIKQNKEKNKDLKQPQRQKIHSVKQKSKQVRPKALIKNSQQQTPKRSFSRKKSSQILQNKNVRQSAKKYYNNHPPSSEQFNFESQMIQNIQQAMQKKGQDQIFDKKKLKSNALMRNNQGLQLMQKAKRRFQYQLKGHKHNLKVQKQRKTKQNNQISTGKCNYLKLLKNKQKQMQSKVLNEQLKYYYQLRDKKLSYIKHMHTLMQKLQKQRQLDLHKQQLNLKKKQKQKINKKIQQADHVFEQNINQIKQQYRNGKQNNLLKNEGEIKILRQMQKNMNKNKENQINVMKVMWQQQRMKLDLIAKDEYMMKKKLQEMYRKNRV